MPRRLVYANGMHRLNPYLSVLIGVIAVSSAHASPGCGPTLDGTSAADATPIDLYPWPVPPPELIDRLRDYAGDGTDVLSASVRAAIHDRSPHHSIRAMFAPITLAEVRTYYARDAARPPGHHPLNYDITGRRALIARALDAIPDPDRQREWMTFMTRDPDPSVQLKAARTFLRWPDQKARDAYVAHALDQPRPDEIVLRAAIGGARQLSPAVRWRVIKHFVGRDKVDSDVMTALGTYPERALLFAWYRDQISASEMTRMLATYDPVTRTRSVQDAPVRTRMTEHDVAALYVAQSLVNLNGDQIRTRQMSAILKATNRGYAAGLASDVLAWAEILEILRNYAFAIRSAEYTPSENLLTREKLRTAARDIPLRLQWSAYLMDQDEREAMHDQRVDERLNWSDADLREFERTLVVVPPK